MPSPSSLARDFARAAQQFARSWERAWNLSGRWLPAGWFDALRQIALFGGAYSVYRIVRGIVDGQAGLAFENARAVVDAERGLHLFFEPGLQSWAREHADAVVWVANWMYVNSHFVVTTTFLIWLYLARNHAYYFVSNGNPAARASVYDDPAVLAEFPMAPVIRESLELAAPRPQTAYYSEVSGSIQRVYHPPASVVPGQTGPEAAELITAVLAGEQLL